MNANELYDDLLRRGVALREEAGGIKWRAPYGVLAVADIRAIKECKVELSALLRTAPEPPSWPLGEPSTGLDRWGADPRPDLVADSASWESLLKAAYVEDGDDPTGAFGCLHGLRCLGARLVRDGGDRVRIERGEEITANDYATFRFLYLAPRSKQVIDLLASLSIDEAEQLSA